MKRTISTNVEDIADRVTSGELSPLDGLLELELRSNRRIAELKDEVVRLRVAAGSLSAAFAVEVGLDGHFAGEGCA